MRNFLFILLFFAFCTSVYAQHSVTVGHTYFDANKDYSMTSMGYEYDNGGHRIMLMYDRMDGRSLYDMPLPSDSAYDPLQRVGLVYMYFGDRHMWGGVVSSASDKLFNTFEDTSMIAFYGYNIFERPLGVTNFPLPDGGVFEYQRRARLFVGVGATKDPIAFGQHFLPVFSYIHEGQMITLVLGLPFTSVTIRPAFEHQLTFRTGFQGNMAVAYDFMPNHRNTIRLEYTEIDKQYKVSDAPRPENRGDRVPEIHYKEHWLRATYEHRIGLAEISAWVGYMFQGYYFYGKYFRTSSDRKLESTMQYGASVKLSF
jgi:hypothetical protein